MGEIFSRERSTKALAFTGERLTGESRGQIEIEHIHRYLLAREYCRGKNVLDVASGEGYGTAILAQVARFATGLEVSQPVVEHAASCHVRSNLSFLSGDARHLPFRSSSMDVVVSFETIEHFAEHELFLAEIRRVLRRDGLLILSTPEREVYSPVGRPANWYHVRELTRAEFAAGLAEQFQNIALYAQRPMAGSALIAHTSIGEPTNPILFEKRDDDHLERNYDLARAPYLVAFASNVPLHKLTKTSLYIETSELDQILQVSQSIQNQLQTSVNEVNLLKDKIGSLQHECNHLQYECRRFEHEYNKAAHQAKLLEHQHNTVSNEHRQLEHEHRQLEHEHRQLEHEHRQLEHEHRKRQHEHESLQAEYGQRLRKLEEEISSRDRKIIALQAALTNERASLASTQSTLADCLGEVAGVTSSVSWRVTAPFRRVLGSARGYWRRSGGGRHEDQVSDASCLFDAAFYLRHYDDVGKANVDPFIHYCEQGWREGRNPHALFDGAWYLEQNPDVAAAGVNPLIHYCEQGWREGRNPHALFDGAWYLEQNSDVAAAGVNPLIHYCEQGWREGRNPHALFDGAWYLEQNPDVAAAGVNPLIHYCEQGWREGRNPHLSFDGVWYLEQNPDVAAAGINPLVHFVWRGKGEGRVPDPSGDPARSRTAAITGLSEQRHHDGERRRVVFVSGEPNTPGHQYRIENIAGSLAPRFFDKVVLSASELPERLHELHGAALVWIWRTTWSEQMEALIQMARNQGAKIVFDVDDLMFRPELAVVSLIDGIRSQGFSELEIQSFYSRVQAVMLQADHCTAPTIPLAREIRDFSRPTTVIPNGFSSPMLQRAALAVSQKTDDGLVRVGYAAGTMTHQRDFALISEAIARVLSEHRSVRLVLFSGTIKIEEFPELQRVRDQIEWRDRVPVSELLSEYARFDVNLAPVEVGNRYCESKSELKFFEAALVCVPTIASPTQPYADAIQNGKTGLLAQTGEEWYECLTQLVRHNKIRRKLGKQARRTVLWLYGPERRSLLVTRLVNQLVASTPVRSELFQLETKLTGGAGLPEIDVPEYDVLYRSERRGASRVTIIIPLYNYGSLLEEALESVRQQTIRNVDVVVIDDRSSDNSVAIARTWLERHAAEFNNVALLQNRRNSKLGRTRNAGISFCDTELFVPFDPDNLLLPDFVEQCLSMIDETGAAFVYPTIEQFGESTHVMGLTEYDPALFQCGNYIDAMSMLRKACWLAAGGYTPLDPMGWEDFELWCKFVEKGFFGVRVPKIIAKYRVHGQSMLRTITELPDNKPKVLSELNARHPWLQLRLPGTPEKLSVVPQKSEPTLLNGPVKNVEDLVPILQCPETKEPLSIDGDALISRSGLKRWPIVSGRPVFTLEGSAVIIHPEEHLSNELPAEALRIIEDTPGLVLNLSAGGTATRYPNVVELEYSIFRHTGAVGDVHCLPFQEGVFDAVVCLNAFEHYREPTTAMNEIRRVLKPGGILFLRTAFLQPLHEAPHHYYNCTEFGLRNWMKEYQIDYIKVSDNFNPGFALSWLASELLLGFENGVSQNAAAVFGRSCISELAQFWRDPASRESELWKLFYKLPQSVQEKTAAGWEALGRK